MTGGLPARLAELFHASPVNLFLRLATMLFVATVLARLTPVRARLGRSAQDRRPSAGLPRWFAAILSCAAVTVGAAYLLPGAPTLPAAVTPTRLPRPSEVRNRSGLAPGASRAAPAFLSGVYEPGEFRSWKPISAFAQATGRPVDLVLYYSAWDVPFQVQFAREAASRGATVLVAIEPRQVTMAAVASGAQDAYLRSYAAQVKAFGKPVVISFAAEMNGDWDPWGWRQTPPSVWVAAWRHVVTVFRDAGASNVTWVWAPNRDEPSTGPISRYWPGSSYVGWVGIDGYYFKRTATWASDFAATVKQIRALTSKTIILSEVGIGPVAGQARSIPDLFAGIRADGVRGIVWYDQAQHNGLYHQDWRLEDNAAGMAAYRAGLATVDP